MPYIKAARYLDNEVGMYNHQLLGLARLRTATSPDRNQTVNLYDEIKSTKEKEVVGLDFNRAAKASLQVRWDIVEKAQTRLVQDIVNMKLTMAETEQKTKANTQLSIKERVNNHLLQSRIHHLEAMRHQMSKYLTALQATVEVYRPFQEFMNRCAEKMRMTTEMMIIDRHYTLTLFKQERLSLDNANQQKIDHQRHRLTKMLEKKEAEALEHSAQISELSAKYVQLHKENEKLEDEMSTIMLNASLKTMSIFRIVSSIQILYDSILNYRYEEGDELVEEPIERLDLIMQRLTRLRSAASLVFKMGYAEEVQEDEQPMFSKSHSRRDNYNVRQSLRAPTPKQTKKKKPLKVSANKEKVDLESLKEFHDNAMLEKLEHKLDGIQEEKKNRKGASSEHPSRSKSVKIEDTNQNMNPTANMASFSNTKEKQNFYDEMIGNKKKTSPRSKYQLHGNKGTHLPPIGQQSSRFPPTLPSLGKKTRPLWKV